MEKALGAYLELKINPNSSQGKAIFEKPKVVSEICIAITKSGKPELVTQKLTELGVGSISFFLRTISP